MKRRALLTGLGTLGMLSSLPIACEAFAQPDEFDFHLTPEECQMVGRWLDEGGLILDPIKARIAYEPS